MDMIKKIIFEGILFLSKDKTLRRKILIELSKIKNKEAQNLMNKAQQLIEESRQAKKQAREIIRITIWIL